MVRLFLFIYVMCVTERVTDISMSFMDCFYPYSTLYPRDILETSLRHSEAIQGLSLDIVLLAVKKDFLYITKHSNHFVVGK